MVWGDVFGEMGRPSAGFYFLPPPKKNE